MSEPRKPEKKLVAILPDGSRHELRTRAGYTCIGTAWHNGSWVVLSKGFSFRSVLSRATTKADEADRPGITVLPLRETWPVQIDDYFVPRYAPGYRDRPVITWAFTPGAGWENGLSKHPSRDVLQHLRNLGCTGVVISWAGHNAEFTVDELLARPAPEGTRLRRH